MSRLAPRTKARRRRGVVAVGAVMAAFALLPTRAFATETVISCSNPTYDSAGVFHGYAVFGTNYQDTCSTPLLSLNLKQDGVNPEPDGDTAGWVTQVPAGLAIVGAYANFATVNVTGTGYVAAFEWDGGSSRMPNTAGFPGGPASFAGFWSGTFGWTLACASSVGCLNPPLNGVSVEVSNVHLTVAESPGYGPTFANGSGLWAHGGWVRGGGWSLGFTSNALPGICEESASLNGFGLPGTVNIQTRNQGTWVQCAAPAYSATGINTTQFPNGELPLTLSATDAVGTSNSLTEQLGVDNVQPIVTLSGPTTASSTAGTQYVTATATTGPSGVGSINCSADGGPEQAYTTSPAEIPVSGIGMHTVECTATNRAYDVNGHAATSLPATWQLRIGQPTVSGISFSKLVDALRCRRVHERVRVPARWVVRRHHGKLVRVHRHAHTKVVRVIKCRAHMALRKVSVYRRVRRHGRVVVVRRKRLERVVVPPHVRNKSAESVRYGQGAVVHGWLGTAGGVALPGRSVVVLTAVDNGGERWRPAAAVTTEPNGSWSARLPRGPSRLVEAIYTGDPVTLASVSTAVRLVVPARIKLRLSPRQARWGGTVRISGRVLGGYIPKGKLLRLRIGIAGLRGTVGIPSITRNGRFHTTWTFSSGHGIVRYWFSVSTLNEADYPFASGSSRRVYVPVGPG